MPTLPIPTITTQTSAPAVYDGSVIDKNIRTVPAVTVPPNVNDVFHDTSFGTPIRRMTNGTIGSMLGSSHRTPSSEVACAWGRNSDRFYLVNNGGTVEYFTFDQSTGRATYVKDLPFNTEPSFSRVRPSIIYGVSGFKIIEYDTNTGISVVIFDLKLIDPTYAVSGKAMGSIQSSATTPEYVTCFYGGKGQDKHFKLVVFDASNNANRLILDTQALTVNGAPITGVLAHHIHAVGIDQSGKYVLDYPTGTDISNGVPQTYVWDITLGTFAGLTKFGGGHACDGYGDHVNQDSGDVSPYDAIQYQYRPLNNLNNPTHVVNPPMTPKMTYEEDHGQWNNARSDVVVPFCTCTFRYYENIPENTYTNKDNNVAWRAWDNEVLTIHPVTGVINRWCHHFANVYTDDGSNPTTFWYQPIPQISSNGRWILFDSNMLKTLGVDAASTDPAQKFRTDVFLVDTGFGSSVPPGGSNSIVISRDKTVTIVITPESTTITS